jgi:hypothetical protein
MKGMFNWGRWAAFLALASVVAASPAESAVPSTSALEGLLLSSGGGPAADGNYTVTIGIYSSETGGSPVWTESGVTVAAKGGQFSYALGSKTPLTAAALSLSSAWIGVQIGSDPELPRKPMGSVAFALRAAVAEGLECTGCLKAGHLDAGVLQPYAKSADLGAYAKSADLGAYAKTADLAAYAKSSDLSSYAKTSDLADYVKAASLAKVAGTGSYSDLLNKPTLSAVAASGSYADLSNKPVLAQLGGSCGTNLVMKGIKADGSYECVSAAIAPDMLNEVSNDLIWNQFVDKVDGTKDIQIKDGFAAGVTDSLTFPDVGLAQKVWVDFSATNSDISKVVVELYGPGMSAPYILYNGGKTGSSWTAKYNDGDALVSGDMNKDWLGKNIKGNWSITVKDTSAIIVPPGTPPFVYDGKFNWTLNIQTLSNKKVQVKGDLIVDGKVSFKGDAEILGQLMTQAPGVQKFNRKFTAVVSLRSGSSSCPTGWTFEKSIDLRGGDDYVYGNIHTRGLFLGAMNSKSYGHEQLYWGYNYNNFEPTKSGLCWKTFDAPSGNAHASMFLNYGGGKEKCPSGYHHFPFAEIKGNNDWGYVMGNKAGVYIGYVDTWDYNAQAYNEDGGWYRRWFRSSEVSNICLKVYGTTDEPATQNGVFPVFLGTMDANQCPAGWNVTPMGNIVGGNGYTYNLFNNSHSIIGGLYDWGHGGDNYLQNSFQNGSYATHLCWKHFPVTGRAFAQVRMLQSGGATCPNGSLTFDASKFKGSNGNGYFQQTGHALMITGQNNGWGTYDLSNGYLHHNFTSYVNKFCLKMENVVP